MFRELSNLSIPTVIFMTLSILFSALAVFSRDLQRIDLMLFAILFFNLFIYSVLSERIKRCEK